MVIVIIITFSICYLIKTIIKPSVNCDANVDLVVVLTVHCTEVEVEVMSCKTKFGSLSSQCETLLVFPPPPPSEY